ncbi:Hypothetical_protein [Hexamita inflata]|uniref:Hypothetical_protein n=1 Tax=Hexamita inflata TaxID=28002 RepID=A0AA86RDF9_9EUKA|nr:Hypothetical protein HINF_LOCUS53290 [Hexamita inflata]
MSSDHSSAISSIKFSKSFFQTPESRQSSSIDSSFDFGSRLHAQRLHLQMNPVHFNTQKNQTGLDSPVSSNQFDFRPERLRKADIGHTIKSPFETQISLREMNEMSDSEASDEIKKIVVKKSFEYRPQRVKGPCAK